MRSDLYSLEALPSWDTWLRISSTLGLVESDPGVTAVLAAGSCRNASVFTLCNRAFCSDGRKHPGTEPRSCSVCLLRQATRSFCMEMRCNAVRREISTKPQQYALFRAVAAAHQMLESIPVRGRLGLILQTWSVVKRKRVMSS